MLLLATWIMSDIIVGEMYQCDFFGGVNNKCGTRNFLNFLGFGYGLPTLAMLALRQNRVMATLGVVQWMIVVGVLLVHQGHAPRLFYRNMVNCEWRSCPREVLLTGSWALPLLFDRHELFERTQRPSDVFASTATQNPVPVSKQVCSERRG